MPFNKKKSQHKKLIKITKYRDTQSNHHQSPVLKEIKIYLQFEHQKQQLLQMENPKQMSPSPKYHSLIAKHLMPLYPLHQIPDCIDFSTINQIHNIDDYSYKTIMQCNTHIAAIPCWIQWKDRSKKRAELSNTYMEKIQAF